MAGGAKRRQLPAGAGYPRQRALPGRERVARAARRRRRRLRLPRLQLAHGGTAVHGQCHYTICYTSWTINNIAYIQYCLPIQCKQTDIIYNINVDCQYRLQVSRFLRRSQRKWKGLILNSTLHKTTLH